jgi:plastocyanin
MMQRATRFVVAALVSGLALAGCGGGGEKGDQAKDAKPASSKDGPLSGEAPVRIVNFEFKPKTVVVTPGTKVTWTNDDTNLHDVKDTSPLANPVSSEMSKGETFAITYAQPGTYSYVCGIHPYMTGSVEVAP